MVLVQIYQYVWEVPGPWVKGGYMASLCTMNYGQWQLTVTNLTIDYNSDNDKGFQKGFQN